MTKETSDKIPWTDQLRPFIGKYLAMKKRNKEAIARSSKAWTEMWDKKHERDK